MYTYDVSACAVRYLIRGYFDGAGQHWIRVWDRAAGVYLAPFCRDHDEAERYLANIGVTPVGN